VTGIEDCFGAGDRFRTDDLVLGKFFAEIGSPPQRLCPNLPSVQSEPQGEVPYFPVFSVPLNRNLSRPATLQQNAIAATFRPAAWIFQKVRSSMCFFNYVASVQSVGMLLSGRHIRSAIELHTSDLFVRIQRLESEQAAIHARLKSAGATAPIISAAMEGSQRQYVGAFLVEGSEVSPALGQLGGMPTAPLSRTHHDETSSESRR
jgi:hypothetical protein